MPDSYNDQFRIAMESKERLTVKTITSFISALIVLAISLFPFPNFVVAITSVVCIAVVFGICFHELFDAVVSAFKKDPSNDSLCAAALLCSLVQSVFLIFSQTENPCVISWVVLISLGVSMLMKLLYVMQIIKNIEFINDNKTFFVEAADADLKKRFISKVFMVNPVIDFPDVLSRSYEEDPAEKNNRIIVPAFLITAIVPSILCFIFRGAEAFFVALAATTACGASFVGETAFVMPYIISQHKLRKLGSILLGARSVDEVKDIDTLVISDTDLFTDEYAGIVNIRFFKNSYVSKSLEYAAVLLDKINSPIAPSVFETLECERKTLPHVSFIKTVQNHGVYASVNGEEVLLGNRNLLLSHNIQPLSQQQEAAYLTMNRNLFYLSVGGELVAVLLVQYLANPAVKQLAERIGGNFNIIVETRDCNINEYTVRTRYNLQNAQILVPENEERKTLFQAREALVSKCHAPVMITTKSAIGILSSVERAKRLSMIIGQTIFVRNLSIFIGAALTAVAIFAAFSAMSPAWVLLFNLIWAFPVAYLSLQ